MPVAVAALVALAATLVPPQSGVLVPGRSLGGVRLGDARVAVVAKWGNEYGVCRGCRTPTLYFNRRRFEPQGAGVSLRRGRVAAVFTLWAPSGWRTSRGLLVNDNEARIAALYGVLPRTPCAGYDAFELPRAPGARSAIYVRLGAVWGFALMRPGEPLCR